MKLSVRVKPNSRKETVTVRDDGSLTVAVSAPPHEGRANDAVIAALSRYLKKPKSSLRIVSGFKAKNKVVEIIE